MANISSEISTIKTGAYGEQVRDAIISASNKINENGPTVGLTDIYRGRNLGSGSTFAAASTSDQRTAISSGTFNNLFIGDYWTVNGVVYRIADFNYWKRVGDSDLTTNHIVLVPDNNMGSGRMNASNDTTGGYVNSEMYTDTTTPSKLNAARTKIANDFGNYLLSHKRYFPNATTDGAQSAGAWYTSTVDLMNELMVYGSYIRCKKSGTSYIITADKSQLALFRLDPTKINIRANYWLLDVVSSAAFALVNSYGIADSYNATSPNGVRPVFAVKG